MISVVISAHNEENKIGEAIKSVKDIADEIIVVDNSSTDKTSDIAKKLGAKVFYQKNDPLKIDLQKNFGFSKAKGNWILSLDADERLTPNLILEIKKTVENPKADAYYIPRKNYIFGKWMRHSLWWPDYQLRLFKNGRAKFTNLTVHKQITVKGKFLHLSEPFIHKNYESVFEYVNRMNGIYTELEALKIISSGKRLSWIDGIKMPLSDFLKTFFLQMGFRDGLHGLMLSVLQSYYMFLVFAKVWEKQGFYEKEPKEVLQGVGSQFESFSYEFSFWMFNSLAKESRNVLKRFIYRICKRTINKN